MADRYAQAALRRPPSFNERDVSDKPWFIGRWNRPLTRRREAAITIRMRQRWESLLAVDEAVAAAVHRASLTLKGLTSFQVEKIEGTFEEGEPVYRVLVRIWFVIKEKMHE